MKIFNIISTSLLLFSSMAYARNSEQFVLKTKFTDTVSEDMPLPEYPRPQFVRSNWINLNGKWDYKIETCDFKPVQGLTDKDSWTTRPIPSDWTGKILVPFSIDAPLSGVGHILRPDEVLWYGRPVEIPETWKGNRIILHFQASDWETSVYINGEKIGQHRGGYDPFSFDITSYLKDNGNTLNVCVWDATEQQAQAIGKQIMPEHRQGFRYQPTGGIWQTVWLECVPQESIENVRLTPVYDKGAIRVELAKSDPHSIVKIRIHDGDSTITTCRTNNSIIEIPLGNFKSWSPESPHLYDMTLSLLGKDEVSVVDEIESYFGMRKIEVKNNADGFRRIYLNNKEIFQLGPLDQGYWPDGILTPPTDEAMAFDLQYLKDINNNMVRVHIKTHPDRWYYHADRIGILVWQDMICTPKFHQTVTKAASEQWSKEFTRMIDWQYNHPSIIQWIVFNEAWGQNNTEEHTGRIVEYDPSRLVTCASGWFDAPAGHIVDIHDYTFYPKVMPDWKLSGKRASLLGEAWGNNMAIPGHTWYSDAHEPEQKGHRNYIPKFQCDYVTEGGRQTYATPEQFEDAYRKYVRILRWLNATGGCCAAVLTQITDVEHELNGFMTYDREISKLDKNILNEINSTLYIPMNVDTVINWSAKWSCDNGKKIRLPAGSSKSELAVDSNTGFPVTVKNTFDIKNLSEHYCIGVLGTCDYEILINGNLFRKVKTGAQNDAPSYSFFEIYPDEADILKKGGNTISVNVISLKDAPPVFDLAVFKTKN